MRLSKGFILRIILPAILIFAVFCQISSSEDDYFKRITMASDGRIARFSHSPVSVYISNSDKAYMKDIEYALNQWSGLSEGLLKFKIISSEDADIRIYWVNDPLSGEADPLGETSLVRFDSGNFYAKISLSLGNASPSVILHEIGHAIGLWGHSPDPDDVMYFRSKAIYPTRRDKDTLLRLMASAPGLPLHEYAINELKADISSNQGIDYLHFWLGSVYADKADNDLAIRELMTALRLDHNLLRASDRLARIFQREGMHKKAIEFYSREAGLEPSPGLYGIIGMLYFKQKEYAMAVDYFQKSLHLDSGFDAAKTNAIASYHLWVLELMKNGDIDEATKILMRSLVLFPSSRVLNYDLGTAYSSKGQKVKAIEQYKKALKFDPSFAAAKSDIATCMNNLGADEMRKRNWGKSIELCQQALGWDPKCWEAQKNLELATLGIAEEKYALNQLADARTYYRSVIDMNPNNLDAYINLGDIYYRQKMYNDALEQFRAALAIDPESHDAKMGFDMAKSHINAGKIKTAILAIIVSLVLCTAVISLYRLKASNNREIQLQ